MLPPVAVKLIDVTVEVNTVVLVLLRIPAIGRELITTETDCVFTHPLALVIVIVPEYEPTGTLAGIAMLDNVPPPVTKV